MNNLENMNIKEADKIVENSTTTLHTKNIEVIPLKNIRRCDHSLLMTSLL